jgi:hypothetical protein
MQKIYIDFCYSISTIEKKIKHISCSLHVDGEAAHIRLVGVLVVRTDRNRYLVSPLLPLKRRC